MAAVLENKNTILASKMSSVFMPGNIGEIKTIKMKKSKANGAELLIMAPKAQGSYPVILFCHGYCTKTSWYSHLLQHISSHGYIIVAPQFYHYLIISLTDEIKTAAKVTNWLQTGLQNTLPENVEPNLTKLAIMGHSRGGKIAFALALGHVATSLKFKALFGLDPVAGPIPPTPRVEPDILSHIPHSFRLSIPVGVIGTEFSNRINNLFIPPLAPNGFNHSEFFNESKPPCCYFLAKDYGHCDFLNDSKIGLAGFVCKSGKGCKEKMRRCVGGIVVAFMNAYLGGGFEDLESIVAMPSIAPITLDPVIYIKE